MDTTAKTDESETLSQALAVDSDTRDAAGVDPVLRDILVRLRALEIIADKWHGAEVTAALAKARAEFDGE